MQYARRSLQFKCGLIILTVHATFALPFKNLPSFWRGITSVYEIFSRSKGVSAGCHSLVVSLKSGCQQAELLGSTHLAFVRNEVYLSTLSVFFFFFLFPVALRPNAGHGLLILEVSRSHTTTYHSR